MPTEEHLREGLAKDVEQFFPELKKVYEADINLYLTGKAGALNDVHFIDHCIRETFEKARKDLDEMPPGAILDLELAKWLYEVAAKAFVQGLLRLLSQERDRYLGWVFLIYEPAVRPVLAKQLGKNWQHPDVDECVQETFLAVVRALKGKSSEDILTMVYLEAYIFRAAKSAFQQFLEREQVSPRKPPQQVEQSTEEAPGKPAGTTKPVSLNQLEEVQDTIADTDVLAQPEGALEQEELHQEVLNYLAILPDYYGKSLELYHLEDLQQDEIAQRLSLPLNNIKSHISRGERLLRKYLEVRKELETNRAMMDYIDTLPLHQAAVVRRHCCDGHRLADITVEYTRTEENVKASLSRGVVSLHKYLEVSRTLKAGQEMLAYVETIPDSYRIAVRLHFFEGRSLSDIAQKHKCSLFQVSPIRYDCLRGEFGKVS